MTDHPESGPREWTDPHLWRELAILCMNSPDTRLSENVLKSVNGLRAAYEKAEARIAELSNGYFGRQAAKLCIELATVEQDRDACIKAHDENITLLKQFQALIAEAAEKLAQAEKDYEELHEITHEEMNSLGAKLVKVEQERDDALARIAQLQVTCGDLTDRIDALKKQKTDSGDK